MVDACCYVLHTGCQWVMLPKSFPPWLAQRAVRPPLEPLDDGIAVVRVLRSARDAHAQFGEESPQH